MHTNKRTNHPSNNYSDIVILRFFKIGASAILDLFAVFLDHTRTIFGALY